MAKAKKCTLIIDIADGCCVTQHNSIRDAIKYAKGFAYGIYYRIFDENYKRIKSGYISKLH